MNNAHQLLQLFYAGVLADSVKHYDEAGILESVTASKFLQQQKAAPAQLKQLEIKSVNQLFTEFSMVFGCIEWNVEAENDGFLARGSKCKLCSIAKSMNTAKPCTIYCIQPFIALLGAIENGYRLKVNETLWEGNKCEFAITPLKPKM